MAYFTSTYLYIVYRDINIGNKLLLIQRYSYKYLSPKDIVDNESQ